MALLIMKLTEAKSVFMVGIKGVGMSALAQFLKARGQAVTGWDTAEEFFTDAILKKAGISWVSGGKFKLKDRPDLAIYSQAYVTNHPLRQALRRRRVGELHYADAVSNLFNPTFGVLVAGSHGKSTTSALIGSILDEAGYKPQALIGTEVLSWQSNALTGQGKYFVLEGDEYGRAFLRYQPKLLVLTNIDWDHPDVYPTARAYAAAFKKLVKSLSPEARIVAFRHDLWLSKILAGAPQKVYWYEAGDVVEPLPFQLAGEHHRANAAAALRAAQLLGINRAKALKTIQNFKGTRRRLEIKAKISGRLFLDDYAHHPTEVAATLKALKERFPKAPLWVVFQPHTFTRTAVFAAEFAAGLKNADQALVLDIYGSARERRGGAMTSEQIVARRHGRAVYTPQLADAEAYLKKNLPARAVLVTMGAGDVWKLHERLVKLGHYGKKQ